MARRNDPVENASALGDAFSARNGVFSDKALLDVGYVPGPEHIVARNEEIRRLATALNPAISGAAPSNVFLYGKTGTGKSLCARYTTRRIVDAAAEEKVDVGCVVVDCSQDNTETRAVRATVRGLNDPEVTDLTIPETGLGRSRYYSLLWEVLDARFDVAFVVLDEIDCLDGTDFLMQLSRATEAKKLDRCSVGIVGISNKVRYRDRLEERVKSSLQEREIMFTPYDREALREIIRSRLAAFDGGVLDEDVISECASLAAEEHGDARKAINLLRHSGELAASEEADRITVDHVHRAKNVAEQDRMRELIDGATIQQKATLLAVTSLALVEKTRTFKTPEVYAAYEDICGESGLETLSKRRVHDLLREWEFLEVLEITRTGGGRARGSYLQHRLLEDPSVIRSGFDGSDRFAGVGFSAGEVTTTWSNI
ncbi:orc1/cdc6 family replication initiation protein [Halogeometricum sp. S1BR25-6]|uniref:ORC1-type DNA replication protein n=1 Tax=Halogeometricum salsisoli TaxID=2950536 RepID=A0ABU2GLR3_9EURY|nr:orc1/cdc6 family replication initiation protein [Halogeometricum sp. S1BR25-6]MDS0301149.1 orc1/cdc6 family replication initiation protein [Halogeometricum sp. S1BR25-6]